MYDSGRPSHLIISCTENIWKIHKSILASEFNICIVERQQLIKIVLHHETHQFTFFQKNFLVDYYAETGSIFGRAFL